MKPTKTPIECLSESTFETVEELQKCDEVQIVRPSEAIEAIEEYHAQFEERPVIKARALRNKGTDKWYCLSVKTSPEGLDYGYYYTEGTIPEVFYPTVTKHGIEETVCESLPTDAELVNITIIVEE